MKLPDANAFPSISRRDSLGFYAVCCRRFVDEMRVQRNSMAALNTIDLAHHYFVSDLPGSTIPASRLRDILDKLQEGRPLTTNGLNYLRQLGLSAARQMVNRRGEAFLVKSAAMRIGRQLRHVRFLLERTLLLGTDRTLLLGSNTWPLPIGRQRFAH